MFALGRKNMNSEAILQAMEQSQATAEFSTDGTILQANSNFLKLMGYELQDLMGKHHSIFVDQSERESARYKEFWRGLVAGKFQIAEYRRIRRDGQDVWMQASYNPLRDRSGKVQRILKIATDITAQKMQSIQDARQIEAIGHAQAVIEFDLDGKILAANEIFLNVMGYSLSEIVGRHHSIFIEPDERDSAGYRQFWSALRRGEHMSAEYKRIAKSGKEVWIVASYNPIVDERNRPVKVVKIATDITAQKMKTADLAGQIDAIGKAQAVIQFDMDGTILTANENFLRAVGYSLAEIVGRHHSIFVPREDAEGAEYREFWHKLRRGEYQAAEYRRVGKGGKSVWIQASYNPILDLNGRPCKVVKYATDTTRQVLLRIANERVCKMMETVAAGAEELNASVREISEAMTKSRETATSAVQQVEAADAKAKRFSEAAGSMEGIVELIGNITGQINLLALNATIESARAGEAGRGFAVVASEVKNLANQARQATKKISGEIGNLNEISSDVVSALTEIRKAIQDVSEYVTTTAAAVEEQSTVTSEMSASMQRAASEAAAMATS